MRGVLSSMGRYRASTQYVVLGARCSAPGAALFIALCLAVPLLALSGCSSYEPNVRASAKTVTGREPKQIAADMLAALNDVDGIIANIKNAEEARVAMPKVNEIYARYKTLLLENVESEKHSTPEQDQAASRVAQQLPNALDTIQQALTDMKTRVPAAPELGQAFLDFKNSLDELADAAKKAGPGALEIDSAKQPAKSCWMIWILLLFVIAACVGFLFREGMWANAVRLVNVIFSGLLAMNFYEPLAKFAAGYSDDICTFAPFLDFLSFWACFIAFAAVLVTITDKVSRVRIRFPQIVEQYGSPLLSLGTGWVMAGIVLASLHMAPLSEYPFLECFQPQAKMFFGVLAPDREWLGFTKYQSAGPYCMRSAAANFPDDFIKKYDQMRIEIEKYVKGNLGHAIRINPQLAKKAPNPAPKPPGA